MTGKICIDFEVLESKNPNLLFIIDTSEWKVIENLPSFLYITLPGSRKPKVVPFQKNSIQEYSRLSLGLTKHRDCVENIGPLPDGVYEIEVRGGKNGRHRKKKYYLKIDKINKSLLEEWLKIGQHYYEDHKKERNALLEIEGFLRAAQAMTEEGNITEASSLYKISKKRLEKYKNCVGCI